MDKHDDDAAGLIQMETLFACGCQQTFAQHFLGRIVGQLQIVHARVDRWITAGARIDLPDDRQTWMQIGQTAGRQTTAASCELQEGFAFGARHFDQHVYETYETGAVGDNKKMSIIVE